MTATLDIESTLTDRYQTTVPETVRRSLGLKRRDKIHYQIQPSGDVLIRRAEPEEEDPAILAFLAFLAKDIETNPERLEQVDRGLIDRARALTSGVTYDINEVLPPDDE